MKSFTYSPFLKFLYRFGNIPITFLLLLYAIPLLINLDRNYLYLIPSVITLFLIYYLNKNYLELYKILPYKIEADEEKLVASDYIFSQKKVTMYFEDITDLKGGIFDGRLRGVMRLTDGRTGYVVSFYQNIKNAQLLQTIILSKVKKELYEKTLEQIKSKRKIKTSDGSK